MSSRSHQQKAYSHFDKILVAAVSAVLIFGLVMVASASIVISEKQFGSPFHFLLRQLIFMLLAFGACYFLFKLPIHKLQEFSANIFIFSLLLLVIVLIPHVGRSINGSARWLGVGPLSLQVSEFAKLAVILYLAGYLVRQNQQIKKHISGFIRPMCLLLLIAVLLLKEPDFGASVVIFSTALAMMFLAGMRLSYFVLLLAMVLVGLAAIAISSPYRVLRITSFLHPWVNQYGSGYQLTQALIAFGNGGFFGVGLGNSMQKLFYLPEAQTDFLFAIVAEELGLLGIVGLFVLYSTIVYRALRIGRLAQMVHEHYSGYVAYGIGVWLGLQFLINVGVNSGFLPTKGLTLPLMSYGGSSLLIDLCAIAILLRIDFEVRIKALGL